MAERGYSIEWKVYNSKDYGGRRTENVSTLLDIMETSVPEVYYLSKEKTAMLLAELQQEQKAVYRFK